MCVRRRVNYRGPIVHMIMIYIMETLIHSADYDGEVLLVAPFFPSPPLPPHYSYKPKTERQSHYFSTSLAAQYDSVIHIDETRAVEPLRRTALWEGGEEETYPTGL